MEINFFVNELANVAEAAAIKCYKWIGKGKKNEADADAVFAMRSGLNKIDFDAKVAIGEGERDKAPMLFIGERLGKMAKSADPNAKHQFDIAVDPLEGTNLCANNKDGAIAVLAIAKAGDFLCAPDVYMEKIAVSKHVSQEAVSLKNSVTQNLFNIKEDLGCKPEDIIVTILERTRHESLIKEVQDFGARVKLISDGDVNAIIATELGNPNYVNVYLGTGGAPEGVLAAAALKTLGGYMEGKLLFNEQQRERAKSQMKMEDFNKVYTLDEIASGDCAFIATGVTNSDYLDGVHVGEEFISTHSMILTSWDKSISYIEKSRIRKT